MLVVSPHLHPPVVDDDGDVDNANGDGDDVLLQHAGGGDDAGDGSEPKPS